MGEDDNFFHLHDTKSDKPFKVAKKGLSATMHGRIAQHFAEGGGVEPEGGVPAPASSVDDGEGGVPAAGTPASPKLPPSAPGFSSDYSAAGQGMPDFSNAKGLPGVPFPVTTDTLEQLRAKQRVKESLEAQADEGKPEADATEAKPGKEEAKEAKKEEPKSSPAAAPQATAARPTGSGMGGLERRYMQGAKAQGDAEAELARVAGARGLEQQTQKEEEVRWLQDRQQKREAAAAANQQRIDKVTQDIAAGQVDPNHFWASRSTGQHIAGAIALALGGFAQAFTHGGNPAMEIMDKAIDRDIDAQKANLNSKNNLVRLYMEQGHNIDEAATLARLEKKDMVAAQYDASAAKFAGPEAQAQAKVHRAQMTQQTAMQRADLRQKAGEADLKQLQLQQIRQEMALRPVILAVSSHANTGGVLPESARAYMDPERTVTVPGHGVTYANTKGDRDEVAQAQQSLHSGLGAVRRLRELSGKTGLGGTTSELGQLAVTDAKNAYQSILGRSNAPRGEQEKELEAALSNPTSWWKSKESIKQQADALEKVLRRHAAAVFSARLVGGLDAAKGFVEQEGKAE